MKHTTAFASEMTWPDYDAAVRGGRTPILIPIGSMEQHGHHMPLHVDVLLPTEFARRVALEIGALVAPPFTYGYKSHQKSGGGNHLPGTTSLDGATLVAALKDVVKEFARHGVRQGTGPRGVEGRKALRPEGSDHAGQHVAHAGRRQRLLAFQHDVQVAEGQLRAMAWSISNTGHAPSCWPEKFWSTLEIGPPCGTLPLNATIS